MIAEYIYLGDQPLAMITKPAETEIVSYFHNDHLGTPLILTNDNQTIVWKAAYTPFGGADISVQTVENPFRLPGQYYDPETGLHYNYFRYYDPTTGRYITPDPIGLEGGINLFLYVGANPLMWIDPLGLVTWPAGYKYVPPGGEFGDPRKGGRKHKGLDIRNPIGDPVYASDSGTVIRVWYDKEFGGGNSIIILHADGSESGYAHTGSIVVVGQRVEEGEVIGYSDKSGAIHPHLHYTYRQSDKCETKDPRKHLKGAKMPKSKLVP